MSDDGSGGFLDRVYGIETPEQTRQLYEDWAQTYDDEVRANGYATPGRCAAALSKIAADKAAPLLDLGCGTGLSGEAFREAGFTTIDGTDFSPEMLRVAERKGIYRRLIQGDLQRPIPAEPGDYAHAAAVGVFSPAHGPAGLIEQVIAVLPEGGGFVFSLNDHALADPSYDQAIQDLVDAGRVEQVHRDYGDHLPGRGLKSAVVLVRKL
jgi:predicted TPR repeat methyltransferase